MASSGNSSKSVVVLICGIASWVVLPILCGLVAWFLGNDALKDIQRGTIPESDRSMIQIGRILGIANVVLSLLGFCIFFGLLAAGIGAAAVTSR